MSGYSNGNEPESRSFKIAARCCLKIEERESAEKTFFHFQSFSRIFMQEKLIFWSVGKLDSNKGLMLDSKLIFEM